MKENSYLGSIGLSSISFTPVGWLPCEGQLLPISQYTALFSLIGTIYGGDGSSTFQLPDLRGRTPIGAGQGIGLPNYPLGTKVGEETFSMTQAELPPHSHVANHTLVTSQASTASIEVMNDNATTSTVTSSSAYLAKNVIDDANNGTKGDWMYKTTPSFNGGGTLNGVVAATSEQSGTFQRDSENSPIGQHPFSIQQPYTTLRFCICVNGIYPPRN